MQYDAITLDANVFIRNGLNFETGLLAQLVQFKEGSAQFVISEVVFEEIQRHLNQNAIKASSALEKAIKELKRNALLSSEAEGQLHRIHDAAAASNELTKKRLQLFLDRTGPTIVPAESANMKELIKLYFAPTAPFEASGEKKSEFPDAIALLSLEAWARANNTKILAISEDTGWANYAKGSEWIDVETNLTAALQRFQAHTEQARALVHSLLVDLDAGRKPGFRSSSSCSRMPNPASLLDHLSSNTRKDPD